MDSLLTLPQLGKGLFSRCYKLDNSTVLIESYDPIKAAMADGKFPKSKLFPKVHHATNPFGRGYPFYKMKLYDLPKRPTRKWLQSNLEEEQFALFSLLSELRQDVQDAAAWKDGTSRQQVWTDAYNDYLEPKHAKILVKAHRVCCEVGETIMLDCLPKNVAVDDGKLILLDCFYSSRTHSKYRRSTDKEWALPWE